MATVTPRSSLEVEAKDRMREPTPAALPEPRRFEVGNLLFGRKLRTEQEVHERLGNATGLAVFASDALSSVAYATEEMLRVLLPVALALAFGAVLPLSFAIVVLLVALVFSYRQTIKAYPSAGGAYIVTRDNFGLLPAQVAGVALLTDYILTVAVSVSAGVAALYSALPSIYPLRVVLAVSLIWLIALANLRGVRESGRFFAVPTYLFVVSILGLIVTGLVRSVTTGLDPIQSSHSLTATGTAGGLGIFVLLHAFAGGSTAMTGVEAISNGVPAFKPIEWKNARRVLAWLGVLLGSMFLGIGFLAWQLRPVPTEDQTVVSQLARAILGDAALGDIGFFVVQAATVLILVLAANTAYADFPRLASFHAHDHFLPSPLTRRGRRLVFSNGIVVLAALASLLVIAFAADVHRLIPLYAIGVFTSFTLSQAGMARRHLRLREAGWRRGLFVNGVGAIASGVVGVVIAVTKFTHGAWVILVIVPVTVAVLVRVNHHYEQVATRMQEPDPALAVLAARRLRAMVLVGAVDDGLDRAMQYVEHVHPDAVIALHVGPVSTTLGAEFWARYGHTLEFTPMEGGLVRTVRERVATMRREHRDCVAAVVVPEVIERVGWRHLLGPNDALRLKAGLLFEAGVVVVNVPTVRRPSSPLRPPRRHVALVPVAKLHGAALEALRVAEILSPDEVRAVHLTEDPDDADALQAAWERQRLRYPLDLIAAPYREVVPPLLEEVRALRHEGADLVTVVINELVPKWWHHGLHNHRALAMKAALLFEPGVAVVSVPHRL